MKNFLFVRLAILAVFLSTGLWQASAASVSLKTSDALGTHSWAGSTNWDNGAVPSAGNDYFTKNFQIRTLNPATNGAAGTNPIAFAGSSLSIDPGGSMNTKHFGNFICNR